VGILKRYIYIGVYPGYTGCTMRKQTTIKLSKEFKQHLTDVKKQGESFEDTVKRLIESIPSAPKIEQGIPVSAPKELNDDEALEVLRDGQPINIKEGRSYA